MPRELPGDPAAEAATFDRYFRDTMEAYIGDYAFFRTEPGVVTAVDTGSRTCTATVSGVSVDGIEYPRNAPAISSRWYITRTSKGHRWLKTIATFILDTFTRADNASSLTVCDTGQTWNPRHGTWGITGNLGYLTDSSALEFYAATLPCGSADGTITARFPSDQSGNSVNAMAWGVVFRYTDLSNYFYLIVYFDYMPVPGVGNIAMDLRKVAAGVDSLVNSAVPKYGDIEIVLNGNGIDVRSNGTSAITTTDSFNNTATDHGICVPHNLQPVQVGEERWSYFRFDPA